MPLLHGFGITTKEVIFKDLARAQFHENPPQRKFVPMWHIDPILDLLSTARFNTQSATFLHLFQKTLFLTALAAGNRVSEIAAMSRTNLTFNMNPPCVKILTAEKFLYSSSIDNNNIPRHMV